ncbi:MAG: hypothetical protein V4510_07510 [bacterium]
MRLLPLALLVLVVLAPAAMAHCASLPRAQDTRLLEDYVDECTSDGGTNDCKGSDELLALDIQEKWDGAKDVAVFRLLMDKGSAGAHTDTITVTTPKGAQAFVLKTSDDSHFTNGGGFDSVTGGASVGDGTRFVVEGTIMLSKLGAVGDGLSGIKVEADSGDFMPGTCHNTALDCPPAVGARADCFYDPTSPYKLRGSSYYTSLETGSVPDVGVGSEQVAQLSIKNLLDASQQGTLTVTQAGGVTARLHDPASGAYSESLSIGLSSRQAYNAHLSLVGATAGAQGSVTVTITTDLGGHRTLQVPFKVTAASTSHETSHVATTGGKSSPGLEAPAILLTAVVLARRRMR